MNKNNKMLVSDNCCGCGLCFQLCPNNSIYLIQDEYGFRKAYINSSKCSQCMMCKEKCIMNHPIKKNIPLYTYGAWHISGEVRKRSSSGGIFTAIAEAAFKDGIPVYAVNENISGLFFSEAKTYSQIEGMRGSKYYQAFLDADIISKLKKNESGVFVGLPCQVAMVKQLRCNRNSDDFIYVDLICHGVSSKWLVDKHRKDVEKCCGKTLISHTFRNKCIGSKGSQVSCYEFSNEKEYINNVDDYYMRLFFPNYSLMKSCYSCPYADVGRVGDITIGDYNGASKVFMEVPEDGCVSALLVNNEKGNRFIEKCNIVKYSSSLEVLKEQNTPLVSSPKKPIYRKIVFPLVSMFGVKVTARICGGKYYIRKFLKMILGDDRFNSVKKLLGRKIIEQ